MDVVLARTFLEVVASGSFVAAAERLNLTQTAVSARIRALEDQLGRRLFVRNKAGARLTPAGERLIRHATTLIQVWERARQEVALPSGREEGVSVGGELSLWQPLLADWLVWMHRECPDIALRAEVDSPARLIDRVQDGALDLAVVYNPPQRTDLVNELLVEEKLVMVTTSTDGTVDPERYVYVDGARDGGAADAERCNGLAGLPHRRWHDRLHARLAPQPAHSPRHRRRSRPCRAGVRSYRIFKTMTWSLVGSVDSRSVFT
jgi:DNA-binding transcriptional LysR family regulator